MLEELYQTLLAKVNEGNKCVLLTYLNFLNNKQGSIIKKAVLTDDDIKKRTLDTDNEIYEKICLCLDNESLEMVHVDESNAILIEPFIPNPRLIIFGGGHIAKPLSEIAHKVGFSVTVIDDRPFFANTERFPEAEEVICESFESCLSLLNLRKSDFIVIITRGHRHDGVVLRQVLGHELSYIGMIGSKRRVHAMKEELLVEGFAKTKLDMVNAPIGLDIGAITPDEIAISIVSQLIRFKNKTAVDKLGKAHTCPELDIEVIAKTAEESTVPKALITILSAKGSVPRKAGAKMLAFYDGATIGSIGGGCSEAGILSKAKDIMLDKGFLIEQVDMTGDAAEEEGMVCGGVMEVLVEAF